MPIASGPVETTIEIITALENERFDAMLAADIPTLERLFHERMGYGHSNAARETRSSLLDKIASGALDYRRIEHPIAEVIVDGDTAVVVGEMHATVVLPETTLELAGSTISVWSRSNDEWRLLAFQPTPLPR
jgi:hypothetical protein